MHSYSTHTVLYSYATPTLLLLYSYSAPTLLILYSYSTALYSVLFVLRVASCARPYSWLATTVSWSMR
jgi:hypothetical protein